MPNLKHQYKSKDLLYLFDKEESLLKAIESYCARINLTITTKYLLTDSNLFILEILINYGDEDKTAS